MNDIDKMMQKIKCFFGFHSYGEYKPYLEVNHIYYCECQYCHHVDYKFMWRAK